MEGTDIRGDPNDNNFSWSISFDDAVAGFNEFLFSSGNGVKWLIATKDAVIGEYYKNSKRNIIRSSISSTPYNAAWFRREGIPEDPWITLRDHSKSKAEDPSEFMYGENSRGQYGQGLGEEGMDVYIRRRSMTDTQEATYSYWAEQGWVRVRHIPQRGLWYEGNDNLKGTDVRGDPNDNAESWSIAFQEAVSQFDEFLFSSGDRSKWLIATREAVIGEY